MWLQTHRECFCHTAKLPQNQTGLFGGPVLQFFSSDIKEGYNLNSISKYLFASVQTKHVHWLSFNKKTTVCKQLPVFRVILFQEANLAFHKIIYEILLLFNWSKLLGRGCGLDLAFPRGPIFLALHFSPLRWGHTWISNLPLPFLYNYFYHSYTSPSLHSISPSP